VAYLGLLNSVPAMRWFPSVNIIVYRREFYFCFFFGGSILFFRGSILFVVVVGRKSVIGRTVFDRMA